MFLPRLLVQVAILAAMSISVAAAPTCTFAPESLVATIDENAVLARSANLKVLAARREALVTTVAEQWRGGSIDHDLLRAVVARALEEVDSFGTVSSPGPTLLTFEIAQPLASAEAGSLGIRNPDLPSILVTFEHASPPVSLGSCSSISARSSKLSVTHAQITSVVAAVHSTNNQYRSNVELYAAQKLLQLSLVTPAFKRQTPRLLGTPLNPFVGGLRWFIRQPGALAI